MMASTKYRMAGVLIWAICLLPGCSSPSNKSADIDDSADRVEVYYRDFDTLAPIRYSEEALIRSATFKAVLTDRKSIEAIQELTTLPCIVEQGVSKDQVDRYLLVREYSKEELTRTWAASPFHFLEWPGSDRPCKLKPTDREALKRMFANGDSTLKQKQGS